MMDKRTFLKTLAASSVVAVSGASTWLLIAPNDKPLTITGMIKVLDKLSKSNARSNGQWTVSQILMHCAQSVEYSMTGFPEHKSALFKQTVGKLAFSTFASKGRMTHNLSEAIPSAPALDKSTAISVAHNRFKQALLDFQQYEQPLAPHFAYGKLSKHEYEIAHAMHFYNHLREIA
jgi:hypothetical protein